MKRLFSILCIITSALHSFAQPDTMYVSGRFLYNHAGQKVVLKGINYSVLDDWSFPANITTGGERLIEIEKTKANTVRIQWYNNYGQAARPAYALKDLDTLLTRSAKLKMIPIVTLFDQTCGNDYAAFITSITNWYTQTAVVNLFKKHKRYSIINMANEFGHYRFAGSTTAALNAYKNAYKNAITSLRNAGYTQPIMVDAPDCGTDANAQMLVGNEVQAHDPLHNIIFSTHAYWISFTGNDSTTMANKVQQMVNSNLPFVFGEIANYQSDQTACQYVLNYQDLLETLQQKDIGWLAWNWTFDNCANRQMTPNGLFANMGVYGQDVTNNSTYGLAATAIRSDATFSNTIVLATNKLLLTANCNRNTLTLTYKLNNNANITILQSTDAQNWQTIFQKNSTNTEGQITIPIFSTPNKVYYKAIATGITSNSVQSNVVSCSIKNATFTIYPNPAKSYFTIEQNSIYDVIIIFNVDGKQVFYKNISQNVKTQIPVNNLPNGLYSVKCISTKSNRFTMKKLVVIH